MGCQTAVVVELLLPKSSEEMWPFPLHFKGKVKKTLGFGHPPFPSGFF